MKVATTAAVVRAAAAAVVAAAARARSLNLSGNALGSAKERRHGLEELLERVWLLLRRLRGEVVSIE